MKYKVIAPIGGTGFARGVNGNLIPFSDIFPKVGDILEFSTPPQERFIYNKMLSGFDYSVSEGLKEPASVFIPLSSLQAVNDSTNGSAKPVSFFRKNEKVIKTISTVLLGIIVLYMFKKILLK